MTSKSSTHITTFGHNKGPIPQADEYYDVREVPDTKEAEENEASHLANEITPGHSVALGCEHGEFTSPHIAELVRKKMGNVKVTHRDMYVDTDHKGDDGMLKGDGRGVMSENVRSAKHRGLSEEQAVKHALPKKKKKAKKNDTLVQSGKGQ